MSCGDFFIPVEGQAISFFPYLYRTAVSEFDYYKYLNNDINAVDNLITP
jgi:hypothetical protein